MHVDTLRDEHDLHFVCKASQNQSEHKRHETNYSTLKLPDGEWQVNSPHFAFGLENEQNIYNRRLVYLLSRSR
jgi:hypothetical protein